MRKEQVTQDLTRPLAASGQANLSVGRTHRLKKSVPFLLSDDTGSVLIDSNKADMTSIKRDSEIETATLFSEELPPHIIEYC